MQVVTSSSYYSLPDKRLHYTTKTRTSSNSFSPPHHHNHRYQVVHYLTSATDSVGTGSSCSDPSSVGVERNSHKHGQLPQIESSSSSSSGNSTAMTEISSSSSNRLSSQALYVTVTTPEGYLERSCAVCPYRTTNIANMEKHVKTHSGDKPHQCNICSFRTIQINNLISHMRTHTGEKPFPCSYCSYRASRSNTLSAHIARRHPEVTVGPINAAAVRQPKPL